MEINKLNIDTKTILHLEDSPEDAELVRFYLESGDTDFIIHQVSDKTDFSDAIEMIKPDIILSDFSLDGFDGFEALKIAMEKARDIPFIFVTGAVGEEMAVTALKSGAIDFILKSTLARLVPYPFGHP